MERDILFFIITMASIIIVNSLFFFVNLIFVTAVTGILYYYQRKMQQTLEKAIKDTQKMLYSKKLRKSMIEDLGTFMQGQMAAFMSNSGKNFRKWAAEAGAPEQLGKNIEAAFNWFGEALGSTVAKKRKLKNLGKGIQFVADIWGEDKKEEGDVIDVEATEIPEGAIELTAEQQKRIHDEILTEEQRNAQAGTEDAND